MGDWDDGRKNGLWGDDGIPYGLEHSERRRYIHGDEIDNQDAILLARELMELKQKIKSLKEREVFLKKSLKHYVPLYSYVTIEGVGLVTCKKNQKLQSSIYVHLINT